MGAAPSSLTASVDVRFIEDAWPPGGAQWLVDGDALAFAARLAAPHRAVLLASCPPSVPKEAFVNAIVQVLVARVADDQGAVHLRDVVAQWEELWAVALQVANGFSGGTSEARGVEAEDENEPGDVSEAHFLSLGSDAVGPPPAVMLVRAAHELCRCALDVANGWLDARDVGNWDEDTLALFAGALVQHGSLAPVLLDSERLRVRVALLRAAGFRLSSQFPALPLPPFVAFFAERSAEMQTLGWHCEGLQLRAPDGRLVDSVRVVKRFASGHAPTLLELGTPGGDVIRMVFKSDDLRPDHNACTMFRVFNALWLRAHTRRHTVVSALPFAVYPLSASVGLMEFVADSVSMREWLATGSAPIADMTAQQRCAFMSSAAGSFVACWVLGIRDRHRDNVMIQRESCVLWQLDFKHLWNRTTTGVDAPILCIPRAMRASMVALNVWSLWKQRLAWAFVILRRNASLIMQLARVLFRDLSEDLAIQNCISGALFMSKSDESSAVAAFLVELELSVVSFRKFLKNQLHDYNLTRLAAAH